jgi:anaerobic selenocysteine-containing dehydrogenase
MEKEPRGQISRRDFMKMTGLATLAMGTGASLFGFPAVRAESSEAVKQASGGPYNILLGTGGTP